MKTTKIKNNKNYRLFRLRQLIFAFSIAAVVFSTAPNLNAFSPEGGGGGTQTGTLQIIVSGRSLPLTVTGEMRGSTALIPVVPVAESLGYPVSVDYQNQTVTVRRTGVTASFIKQTGEVTENNTTVTVVPQTTAVLFAPNQSEILLPVEALAPLLDVSIVIDRDKGVVQIEARRITNSSFSTASSRLDVRTLNYDYGFFSSSGSAAQTLSLDSSGRFGSSVYQANVYLIGGAIAPYHFQGGNLTVLRPNNARIQIGDFTTGTQLQFMSTLTRGISYEQPLGDRASVAFFGGKSYGGGAISNASVNGRNNFTQIKYDTTVVGGRFSFVPYKISPGFISRKTLLFDAGAIYFNGREASGVMLNTGFRYYTEKLRLDAETGIGNFHGTNVSRRPVNGFGVGINVNAVYSPWTKLTLFGQFQHYSPNFLSPQQSSQYTDRRQMSAGFTYRPTTRLSFAANVSDGSALTRTDAKTRNYNFAAAYDPSAKLIPRINASYTIIDGSFGRLALARVNLSREYGRFRPYFDFTRTAGRGSSDSYGFGSGVDAKRFGYFQAQQTFTVGRSKIIDNLAPCQPNLINPVGGVITPNADCLPPAVVQSFYSKSGSVDWFPSKLLFNRVQLAAGIGYIQDNNVTRPQARISATTRLPFRQSLQFSYFKTAGTSELRVSLSGSLAFWKSREQQAVSFDSASSAVEGKIRGRVYVDSDYDHAYTPGVDKAMEGVMVILNGGRTAVSDVNGNYDFDQVEPGEQKLSVRMEDIRADLVPSTELEQTLSMAPRTILSSDVRLVKSGSATGRIFEDVNGNNQYDEGEPTLTDIHILSTAGKTTYSEPDGTFLLSDMAPGEQIVYIDSRYLPGDIVVDKPRISVTISPGRETKQVNYIYRIKPRQIEEKVFGSPPSKIN